MDKRDLFLPLVGGINANTTEECWVVLLAIDSHSGTPGGYIRARCLQRDLWFQPNFVAVGRQNRRRQNEGLE